MSHCRLYVRPTHVRNPHDFYVRPVSEDTWLENFQKRIAETEKPLESDTASALPALGDLVLLQHDDHGWVRGRVSELNDGKSNVYTIDYGETVHGLRPDQLRRYAPSAGDPRPTALHCRMRYCEPPRGNTWTFAAAAAFLSYIGHGDLFMTVLKRSAGGQLEVELENSLGETISDLMVSTEAASFANDLQSENRSEQSDSSEAEPLPLPAYTYDSLKLGVETDMRVINVEESMFHAVRMERYMGLRSMSDSIGAEFGECRLLKRAERAEGARVVCRVRGYGSLHYYRGSIVQVDPVDGGMHRANVRLLDFAESRILPLHTLRRSKPYLLQESVFAVSCRFTERQLGDTGLRSLLRGGRCIAVKAEVAPESDGEPHVVSIVKVFADTVIHF